MAETQTTTGTEATPTPAAPARQQQPARVMDAGTVARLGAKTTRLKNTIAAKDQRIAELEQQLQTGAPAQRVKELERELKTRDVRTTFDRLARKAGATDDVLDDLWTLSKVDPAGKADEATLQELVNGHKAHPTRSKFFGTATATETETTTETTETETETLTPGSNGGVLDAAAMTAAAMAKKPGPGKGRAEPNGNGAPDVSEDLMKNDPVYVMKNYGRVVAAMKAKYKR